MERGGVDWGRSENEGRVVCVVSWRERVGGTERANIISDRRGRAVQGEYGLPPLLVAGRDVDEGGRVVYPM